MENTKTQDFTEDELIIADIWLNKNKVRLSDQHKTGQQIHENFLEYNNSKNRVERKVYE
jgi:hypothetical protein